MPLLRYPILETRTSLALIPTALKTLESSTPLMSLLHCPNKV